MAMYKSGQKYPYPFKHCRLEELAERAMAVSCAAGRVAAAKLPHGGGARLDSRGGGARAHAPWQWSARWSTRRSCGALMQWFLVRRWPPKLAC